MTSKEVISKYRKSYYRMHKKLPNVKCAGGWYYIDGSSCGHRKADMISFAENLDNREPNEKI